MVILIGIIRNAVISTASPVLAHESTHTTLHGLPPGRVVKALIVWPQPLFVLSTCVLDLQRHLHIPILMYLLLLVGQKMIHHSRVPQPLLLTLLYRLTITIACLLTVMLLHSSFLLSNIRSLIFLNSLLINLTTLLRLFMSFSFS
jgi:hypothetical protein